MAGAFRLVNLQVVMINKTTKSHRNIGPLPGGRREYLQLEWSRPSQGVISVLPTVTTTFCLTDTSNNYV